MEKKMLSFLLVLVMVVFALPFGGLSQTAEAATSGKVGSSTYCTVRINQSLIQKRGKQYAKVKVLTHEDRRTRNSKGLILITLRDERNRYITSFQAKGGDTIKLGDDHAVYRIYVSVYKKPSKGFWSRIIAGGDNWLNSAKCDSWEVTKPQKCRII